MGSSPSVITEEDVSQQLQLKYGFENIEVTSLNLKDGSCHFTTTSEVTFAKDHNKRAGVWIGDKKWTNKALVRFPFDIENPTRPVYKYFNNIESEKPFMIKNIPEKMQVTNTSFLIFRIMIDYKYIYCSLDGFTFSNLIYLAPQYQKFDGNLISAKKES